LQIEFSSNATINKLAKYFISLYNWKLGHFQLGYGILVEHIKIKIKIKIKLILEKYIYMFIRYWMHKFQDKIFLLINLTSAWEHC
jgi:hypothetical protein